jgi:hypothetical protein
MVLLLFVTNIGTYFSRIAYQYQAAGYKSYKEYLASSEPLVSGHLGYTSCLTL